MSELNGYNLSELFSRGTIYELADQYIQKCAETQTVDSEKNSDCTGNGKKKEVRKRFPNLAGFCRYLGTGIEELAETGLDVPQITHLMRLLRERGIDAPKNVYTVAEATAALKELFLRGGEGR